MKQKAKSTPIRIIEGEMVYYIDDMVRPVKEAVRDYTGEYNPFDNDAHVSFRTFHGWMATL